MPDPTSPAPVDMTHEHAIRTMAVERYLLDEMRDEEREAFEAHYFGCATCAADLRMANLIREEFASGAASAPAPAPRQAATAQVLRPARWFKPGRGSAVLPWAVAASLAVVAGYQSLATPSGGSFQPQALTPIVLRGETRGAAPTVTIAEDQPVVALSMDVFTDAGTTALTFDLLGPAGNAITSGRASVPPSGTPLLLLVPAGEFAGAGPHTLVVRDANRPDAVAGEYAFVVSR